MLKHKFSTILIAFFLVLPAYAVLDEDIEENINSTSFEEIAPEEELSNLNLDSNSLDEPVLNDIVPSDEILKEHIPNAVETNPYKNPTSKRTIIKKFLFAMLGVIASSIIIFIGLSVYNRIRDGVFPQIIPTDEDSPLDTPNDLYEAVNGFIERTKWE